ncbi:hypothetical protein BU24DRAFT_418563 [Aaosphaeria arxii CBS 175.79]|uniref:Uncharacterized protein n=1 Tax=Aaosphaeria arxii CBS 175.79 TaxID=1450172 RepID=A0A6A5Y0C3_9PLEO|nr:uncharacterized protein BU24DRAFT_418563 [Aaosphaeria arxii CBS 175.79]KAF2018988.1 hypothetical protein BU24DRAFT_418563 [Aaosphaeria arxii CBS 175.79]
MGLPLFRATFSLLHVFALSHFYLLLQSLLRSVVPLDFVATSTSSRESCNSLFEIGGFAVCGLIRAVKGYVTQACISVPRHSICTLRRL